MKGYLVLHLLCSLVGLFEASRSNMVWGTIQENTTWFLSNLSQVPAMRVSIWYRVQYPIAEDVPTPIITFYNNGQNSPNLRYKCNNEMHGQLHNKDLTIPLIQKYREKFWCWSVENKTWNCHGNIQIQDFKPTSYLFSIGYKCGDTDGNLKGLEYKAIIFNDSKTRCTDLTRKSSDFEQQNLIEHCKLIYPYVAFPNPLGNTNLGEANVEMNSLMNIGLEHVDEKCLSKLKPFLCDIILPRCLPEKNEILPPCRDTCESLLNDCSLDPEFNCDYLPLCQGRNSVTGTIGEDTTWSPSNLAVRSVMTASIEYYIRLITCFLSLALLRLLWRIIMKVKDHLNCFFEVINRS